MSRNVLWDKKLKGGRQLPKLNGNRHLITDNNHNNKESIIWLLKSAIASTNITLVIASNRAIIWLEAGIVVERFLLILAFLFSSVFACRL